MPDNETLDDPVIDPGPKPEPAPGKEVSFTGDEPGAEPEPSEDEEEQPHDLPENWLEHADVKAALEEQSSKAKAELEKTHERNLLELRAVHAEELERSGEIIKASEIIKAAHKAADAYIDWLKEASDPEAGRLKFMDLLSQDPEWKRLADVFTGEVIKSSTSAGELQGIARAGAMLIDFMPSDAKEELRKVGETVTLKVRARDIDVPAGYREMWQKAEELIRADERAKTEKLVGERMREEFRAAARQNGGEPPPRKPGGRSGGSGKNYKDWTPEEQHAASARDIDAMTQKFLAEVAS